MNRRWVLLLILGLLNFHIATVLAQTGNDSGGTEDADFDDLEEEEFSKEDAGNATEGMDTVNIEEGQKAGQAKVAPATTPEAKLDKTEPAKKETPVVKQKPRNKGVKAVKMVAKIGKPKGSSKKKLIKPPRKLAKHHGTKAKPAKTKAKKP